MKTAPPFSGGVRLRCLEVVAATQPNLPRRRALNKQLLLLTEVIDRSLPSTHDRAMLDEAARRIAELTRFAAIRDDGH